MRWLRDPVRITVWLTRRGGNAGFLGFCVARTRDKLEDMNHGVLRLLNHCYRTFMLAP